MKDFSMTQEQQRQLSEGLDAIIARFKSGDAPELVEMDLSECAAGHSDDVPEDEMDVDAVSDEDARNAGKAALELEKEKLTPTERSPATSESIESEIGSPVPEPFKFSFSTPRRTAAEERYASEHAKSDKTEPVSNDWAYRKGVLESNGKSVSYSIAAQKVDWGEVLKKETKTPGEAVERLMSFLTYNIRRMYGGWGRVTEIIVRDQMLIINKSCYMPSIKPSDVTPDVFPFDTIDYIRNGAVAQFFDWGALKKMTSLAYLDIDDIGFYEYNVGSGLNVGRRIGVETVFRVCPSLDTFILGENVVTRSSLNGDSGKKAKKELGNHKRSALFSDGYKWDVYGCSNGMQKFFVGSLKSYATNRGNKKFLRYSMGVGLRAVGAFGAGVFNLGAHLIGGAVSVLRQAVTPISEDEI